MESEPAPGLEAEPNQDDPIEALRERVDALEQELRELAARDLHDRSRNHRRLPEGS